MTDPVPHNRNRLGYVIGMVSHPFVIFMPALVLVLKDTAWFAAAGWVTFIAAIILIPVWAQIAYARRRNRYTYQRGMRHSLYITFAVSMVACVGLALWLEAPRRLVFSLLCLCVWAPLQFSVNARFTKISAHTAILCGIVTALMSMGELSTPGLMLAAAVAVVATGWARIVTGHHTVLQVGLGIVVSASAVLITFVLTSIWYPL
ncbi:MAG: hypothetical protein K8S97_00975 [Anaerolineae bacterium]|nr:hypothetical protein [Anaerolineae bacterium]